MRTERDQQGAWRRKAWLVRQLNVIDYNRATQALFGDVPFRCVARPALVPQHQKKHNIIGGWQPLAHVPAAKSSGTQDGKHWHQICFELPKLVILYSQFPGPRRMVAPAPTFLCAMPRPTSSGLFFAAVL
jgi:hypothetical protein